jgi:histidinol-phosphate phosphatase family protein
MPTVLNFRPDILLDRDGVIVRNRPGDVLRPEDLELLPGAADAVRRLHERGHRVFVLTNQPAIERGQLDLSTLADIHRRLQELVDGGIDQIFVCPHGPDAGCWCRKPRPGLLYQAHDHAGVDLASAVLIGDETSDVDAAWAAGCHAILVRRSGVASMPYDYVPIAADVGAAVDLLLGDGVLTWRADAA